eukprot:CAMPEP_0204412602 /NCGR_PEP_ID=MMETSP0470-20130426/15397_1 /ASSEMBLY_ACC=CAM_ASM_000385 /TAXON_ID=2969 /ORGANISM="Oxyrrhis marina" /LENGTH=66 /DNA_ID=CAMNT_0051408701 /DNA_START=78 /DNA_END=278 /DNA_ORIENTATION=+
MRPFAVLVALCAAAHLRTTEEMDNHKCKVMCQRFGMHALAEKNDAFKEIENPTECCSVCDKEYPAK